MAASYLAAPRLSEEEEAREKASLTDSERIAALSDLYGVLPIPSFELEALADPRAASRLLHAASNTSAGGSSCPAEETEEKCARCLSELENVLAEALESANDDDDDCASMAQLTTSVATGSSTAAADNDSISHQMEMSRVSVAGYRQALNRCPNIVNGREHRLLFLRAELFDTKAAAVRLLLYWTNLISLFGEEYAFVPLFDRLLPPLDGEINETGTDVREQSGPFSRDITELSIGYPRVAPARDASGRALIIFNQSLIERRVKYDRMGMLRACWLALHRMLLEDEQVQTSGCVLVGLGYGQLDQLDRKLDVLLWRSIRDVLPVRIVASHFIYGSSHRTYSMIAPNIKFFFGRCARARLREYVGGESQILEQLGHFGISASILPTEMGGGWSYNKKWYTYDEDI